MANLKMKPGENLAPQQIVELICAGLQGMANQAEAEKMSAYQRHQFAFFGVKTPARRRLVADVDRSPLDLRELLEIADLLWEREFRECQYAAIDLLARHASTLARDTISPLIALAQRKPWWETVDGLAPVIGGILKPAKEGGIHDHRQMDEAVSHESMWVRRIAMTHQLGWRMRVDVDCLFSYALALADDSDFFIRKAIGWALRDYARWNPDAVRAFMAEHGWRFSALTVREALKHVALGEKIARAPG